VQGGRSAADLPPAGMEALARSVRFSVWIVAIAHSLGQQAGSLRAQENAAVVMTSNLSEAPARE